MYTKLFEMNGTEVLSVDSYLQDYQTQLRNRWNNFKHHLSQVVQSNKSLLQFADYKKYGFYVEADDQIFKLSQLDLIEQLTVKPTLVFSQWSGNAKTMSIVGDFNNWNKTQFLSTAPVYGVHTIRIPFEEKEGKFVLPIPLGSKYKVYMETYQGEHLFRHPLHCEYALHNSKESCLEPVFYGHDSFKFEHARPSHDQLRIYETHIGMSSSAEKINTFKNFREELLPLIALKGYNCIQIMAIQEHSYYGSFGYQVTGFFGASSRFGEPLEFKKLIDEAHRLGIVVFLDLVHSHASKNESDGISRYDGSDFLFHPGDHPLWDSKVFNYSHVECQRFLLQNLLYWIREFNVDGFRFDGCMSMMYWHRSAGVGYTGRYGEYFDNDCRVDEDALSYIRLAHVMFEDLKFQEGLKVTSIAEDVSGYPTLATPLYQGGLGFDYRFQMAVPDLWISMMKKGFDQGLNDQENINIGKIRHALINRRYQEKHICYAECHDQSLVGDKTLSMWLLNEQIYTNMSIFQEASPRTKRGIALHKIIRLITATLGGEGYLNFMGNEFGHPEWLDFPRKGNGESYKHCRRQFNLEKETTRYKDLSQFDAKLMQLMDKFQVQSGREFVLYESEDKKYIIYQRANLVFVVSFFYQDQHIVVPMRQKCWLRLVMDSDLEQFGGIEKEADWSVEVKPKAELEEHVANQVAHYEFGCEVFVHARQAYVFEIK